MLRSNAGLMDQHPAIMRRALSWAASPSRQLAIYACMMYTSMSYASASRSKFTEKEQLGEHCTHTAVQPAASSSPSTRGALLKQGGPPASTAHKHWPKMLCRSSAASNIPRLFAAHFF